MQTDQPYILMLEDDEDDRYFTGSFFEDRGYNVQLEFLTEAADVLPYLERCINNNSQLPVLILLDKNARSTSGLETLAQLKAHPLLKAIPVVMISGSAFPQDIAAGYDLGANSFIIKPLNSVETTRTIESFMNYWFNTVNLPDLTKVSSRTFF